ncbi:exodeoxyribonuclease VII small subunit [Methylophilaceae bacterium]|jgi:exodeoxyribonuclease VII small subunit|nr:exodeoxyribonuclease VII small subunit [Methylophilaceae bacterium]MDC6477392.1 exodeoxyribonuclease VII small subunit [Methylophilaceae bacterium]
MTTENINLEKLIAELESIVNKMESDDLNVEDSLKSYEKGISLIKNAQKKLKKIEQKVEILSKEGNLENFNTDE